MINKLSFWCQKVLPLVYDDSLSYYELLCKVVAKLNEVIANNNTLEGAVNTITQELGNITNGVNANTEAIASINATLSDLSNKTNGNIVSINDLQNSVYALQQNLNSLQGTVNEMKPKNSLGYSNIDSVNRDVTTRELNKRAEYVEPANLADPDEYTENAYIRPDGTVISTATETAVSPYIRVEANETYSFNASEDGYYPETVCAYDYNKNFLGALTATYQQAYNCYSVNIVLNDCYYVRYNGTIYAQRVFTKGINAGVAESGDFVKKLDESFGLNSRQFDEILKRLLPLKTKRINGVYDESELKFVFSGIPKTTMLAFVHADTENEYGFLGVVGNNGYRTYLRAEPTGTASQVIDITLTDENDSYSGRLYKEPYYIDSPWIDVYYI